MLFVVYILIALIMAVDSVFLLRWLICDKGVIIAPEKIDVNNLSEVSLYNIYAKIRNLRLKKDSLFLIDMAEKGYIRIRESEGQLFIDKTMDLEKMEARPRSIIKAIFDNSHDSYEDENSIMPVPTVPWKDVSRLYRSKLYEILNSLPGRKVIKKNRKRKSILCLLGLYTAYSINIGISEGIGDGFLVFLMAAMSSFVIVIAFCAVLYIIIQAGCLLVKKVNKYASDFSTRPQFFFNVKCIFGCTVSLFGILFVVSIGIFAVFSTFAMILVMGEGSPVYAGNVFLGILYVVVTMIVIIVEMIRKHSKPRIAVSEVIQMDINVSNMEDYIHNDEEASNLYLLSYMLEREDLLEHLNPKMNLPREWYIGENWSGLQGTIYKLESVS